MYIFYRMLLWRAQKGMTSWHDMTSLGYNYHRRNWLSKNMWAGLIFRNVYIWRSAHACDPPDLNAEHFGLYLNTETNMLEPVTLLTNVLHTPLNVLKISKCGCSSSLPCSTSRFNCSSAHLYCFIVCPCHATQTKRIPTIIAANEEDEQSDSS